MISNSYTQQIARALTSPAQWQQQQRRPVVAPQMPANQPLTAAQQPMQQAPIAPQPTMVQPMPSQAQPIQPVGQMGMPNASPAPIDPRYALAKPRQSNRQMNPGDYGR